MPALVAATRVEWTGRMRPDLLIITRNFPPQRGGLEAYSYHLSRQMAQHTCVRVVALKKPKPHLVWFLPTAFLYSLFLIRAQGTRRVHLCDAALSPVGLVLKRLTRARVTVSAHGLDVTFRSPVYQKVVPACLAHLDEILCVSRAAFECCRERGVASRKCRVIPNGIDVAEVGPPPPNPETLDHLSAAYGHDLRGKRILVTVGRLVKRKGVAWFVEYVLPRLDPAYTYLVVGSGPERNSIRSAAVRAGIPERVVLTGSLPDQMRNPILWSAYAFIMPNISVPGDIEGFGIAALEAGACGVPVIASRLQGIPDAIIDGVTGHLVPERNAGEFVRKIETLDLDRRRIRTEVARRYSWETIGREYAAALL